MKVTISGGTLLNDRVRLYFCVEENRKNIIFSSAVSLDDEDQVRVGIKAMKQHIAEISKLRDASAWLRQINITNDPLKSFEKSIDIANKVLKVLEDAQTAISEKRADIELYGANPNTRKPNNLTKENRNEI